jgi:hypothetical protein
MAMPENATNAPRSHAAGEPRATNHLASPIQGAARAYLVRQPRRPLLQGERFPPLEVPMSLGTILIIALVVLFLSGGGFYWSRR